MFAFGFNLVCAFIWGFQGFTDGDVLLTFIGGLHGGMAVAVAVHAIAVNVGGRA